MDRTSVTTTWGTDTKSTITDFAGGYGWPKDWGKIRNGALDRYRDREALLDPTTTPT